MDPRVEMHAEKLVDYCAEVEKGEKVLIAAPPCASELVEALNAEVASRDAFPMTLWFYDDKIFRAIKKNFDELPEPSHLEAAVEESDAFIALKSFENRAEDSDVPAEKDQEFTKTVKDFFEKAYECRSVLSRHPTAGMAQHADMSTREFEDFFYNAVDRDWSEVEEDQKRLADKLDEGSKLRVVSGKTDLKMSIEGMNGVNLVGKYNMPGSEVLTAPVVDSV
jgi:aminopeptidase